MNLENWLGFCAIALLATATPGQAALLVSVHSVSEGVSKTFATIGGNVVGLLLMSSCSVLGLTAVVMHSAFMFSLIKFLGASYLIYLGYRFWTGERSFELNPDKKSDTRISSLFSQGILVALTNPKAIVFTTALFPQFINANEPLFSQFAILVSSFMGLSFLCLTCYALLASRAVNKTKGLVANKWFGKVFGGAFIGSGVYLASASR